MPITPAGTPPWTRATDHTYYGGDVEKQNYQSQGAIDPLTDVTAEELTRLAVDLAAVVRTAPFAVITMTMNDTAVDDPTISAALMQTGVDTTGFEGDAPPTGFPTCIRQSDGYVLVTFASSYSDPYSVSATYTVIAAQGSLHSSTAGECTVQLLGSNQVGIRVYDSAGTALLDKTVTLVVW